MARISNISTAPAAVPARKRDDVKVVRDHAWLPFLTEAFYAAGHDEDDYVFLCDTADEFQVLTDMLDEAVSFVNATPVPYTSLVSGRTRNTLTALTSRLFIDGDEQLLFITGGTPKRAAAKADEIGATPVGHAITVRCDNLVDGALAGDAAPEVFNPYLTITVGTQGAKVADAGIEFAVADDWSTAIEHIVFTVEVSVEAKHDILA